jgi:electron transport complex protein RnfC
MIKKAFWGLSTPQINYEMLPVHLPETEKIPTPERITLFHPKNDALNVRPALGVGDPVKTGQKLSLYPDQNYYVISPVSGAITSLSPYTGDFGKSYIAIIITPDGNEIMDDTFRQQIQSPTLELVSNYLTGAPGNAPLSLLADSNGRIKTIVIRGLDPDPMVATSQYIAQSRLKDLKKGIQILKDVTDVQDIILITAGESVQGYGHIGARVKSVKAIYPAALPHMVMKDVLGQVVPAGKTCEDWCRPEKPVKILACAFSLPKPLYPSAAPLSPGKSRHLKYSLSLKRTEPAKSLKPALAPPSEISLKPSVKP